MHSQLIIICFRVLTRAMGHQCSDEHLAELESLAGTASNEELYKALLPLAGMGPFTCTNAMQLLSRFDAIPCDSETLRHLKMCRGKSSITSSNLKQAAAEVRAALPTTTCCCCCCCQAVQNDDQ